MLRLIAMLIFVVVTAGRVVAAQPNVILIITDDQGYGDLGGHGNTMLQTPHLDRLARESVRMTNFHVNPTCAETRAALMTGRYSCRTGVWHTINGRSLLRPDELTMADVFAANGFATGIFGKWHLGDNYPLLPQQRGFRESLIHGGGGVEQTPDVWGNDYFDDTYFRNGKPEPQQGYCTDVFFDASLEFIKQHREQPFFCYLATNAAHAPFRVAEEYSSPYVKQGVPQEMANFYGMITNIDKNVGKLLEKLTEWELAQNTILIFMSDNGTAAGVLANSNPTQQWTGFDAGLRGTKASQYEGGHRVPFFVRWPQGAVSGGREVDLLAAQFDLLPTLIDLCELQLPRAVDFDGTSLRSVWQATADDPTSGDTTLRDRTLFVQSQRVDQPIKWRQCAVMKNQWRLIDGQALYDLGRDRGQTEDIAAKHQDVVAELRANYEAWWASVSTRFEESVPIELGSDAADTVVLTSHDWHVTQGGSPWNQNIIKSNPEANGYWAVDVKQAGRYQVTLRSRPTGIPYAFQAGQARVKIGAEEQQAALLGGAAEITFELQLSIGPTRMQTWITEQTRPPHGAFFVEVKRLPKVASAKAGIENHP